MATAKKGTVKKEPKNYRINPPKKGQHLARGTIVKLHSFSESRDPGKHELYAGKYAKTMGTLFRYPWLAFGYTGRIKICDRNGRVSASAKSVLLNDAHVEVVRSPIPRRTEEEIEA